MSDSWPISVIVVDDHPIIRQHIRTQIDAQPDMELIGEGGDGETAVRLIRELHPQIAILDVNMPLTAHNAYPPFCLLDSLKQLQNLAPETGIIILSQDEDAFLINESIRMGVRGYLLKSDALSADLPLAIRAVIGGGLFLSEGVGGRLAISGNGEQQPASLLSRRQIEILTHIATRPDESYAVVAKTLHIAESTLKSHLQTAYRQLEVSNITAAILKAMEIGIIKINHATWSYDGAGNRE